jgi:hypothetical protein
MDVNRLSQGQLIAAGSAIVLFILTFLPWLDLGEGLDSANLWESTSTLDIYILVMTVLVVVPAAMAATGGAGTLPFAGAATTTLLGAIAVIQIFFFLLGPLPGLGAGGDIEQPDKAIGLWLGLLAAIGVAVGGYMALEDEGEAVGPPRA